MRTLRRAFFGDLWHDLLGELLDQVDDTSPRGMKTKEIVNMHLELTNPRCNILGTPERNLGYKFMVAEWLWIWFGHKDVETIAQYNKNIAQFSDDGKTFNGAYGPRIIESWGYVERVLKKDPDTRQAIIDIYRRPSETTKDVSCTLTVQFLLRNKRLHAIVNMRSSDTWLGLPYDFFVFSMLQNTMGALLNVRLGSLFFNLGSSHLYERDFDAANKMVFEYIPHTIDSPTLDGYPPAMIHEVLKNPLRTEVATEFYPWNLYANVLSAPSNKTAREILVKG
jgi:thymidylate synthase